MHYNNLTDEQKTGPWKIKLLTAKFKGYYRKTRQLPNCPQTFSRCCTLGPIQPCTPLEVFLCTAAAKGNTTQNGFTHGAKLTQVQEMSQEKPYSALNTICWGRGPSTLSIIARCSKFSWVWKSAPPLYIIPKIRNNIQKVGCKATKTVNPVQWNLEFMVSSLLASLKHFFPAKLEKSKIATPHSQNFPSQQIHSRHNTCLKVEKTVLT